MDDFLQALIKFLYDNDVAPAEVTITDASLEKSYMYDLPESPDHVFVFRTYQTIHASLIAKNVGVKYIQVLVRDKQQKTAFADIQKLYEFLLHISDVEQNEVIQDLINGYWAIFDCTNGPVKIQIDEHGRHVWGLSFAVKTNIY